MRTKLLCACAALGIAAGSAGAADSIALPPPEKLAPFAQRASAAADRFTAQTVPADKLSTLLWAANGINRAEIGKRTAATAINAQEIEIYVVTADGASLAEIGADSVALKPVSAKDLRPLVAGTRQTAFASAGLALLLVADLEKFAMMPRERALAAANIDTGGVMQNILLAATTLGLDSRPRMMMETEELAKALALPETKVPTLNVIIGVPAAVPAE